MSRRGIGVSIALVGALVSLGFGCSATGSRQAIEDFYSEAFDRVEAEYQRRRAHCEGDQACVQEVERWREAQVDELITSHIAAHERRWEEAYDRRDGR